MNGMWRQDSLNTHPHNMKAGISFIFAPASHEMTSASALLWGTADCFLRTDIKILSRSSGSHVMVIHANAVNATCSRLRHGLSRQYHNVNLITNASILRRCPSVSQLQESDVERWSNGLLAFVCRSVGVVVMAPELFVFDVLRHLFITFCCTWFASRVFLSEQRCRILKANMFLQFLSTLVLSFLFGPPF